MDESLQSLRASAPLCESLVFRPGRVSVPVTTNIGEHSRPHGLHSPRQNRRSRQSRHTPHPLAHAGAYVRALRSKLSQLPARPPTAAFALRLDASSACSRPAGWAEPPARHPSPARRPFELASGRADHRLCSRIRRFDASIPRSRPVPSGSVMSAMRQPARMRTSVNITGRGE